MMNRTLLISSVALSLAIAYGCGDPFVAAGTSASSSGASTGASTGTGGAGGAGEAASATASTSSAATATATTGTSPSCTSLDACGDCMLPACPERYCACQPGTPCADLLDCVASFGATPTATQTQVCFGQNPSGISAFMLFGHCAKTQCSTSSCGAGFRELPACEECAFEKCELPMNQCYAAKPCSDLIACYSNCPTDDAACHEACKNGVDTSFVISADAVLACVNIACTAVCG